ncbi:putative fatty acyl-CoA reductase CG5065 [Ptiloglossa arizonensis]|uniref:putative fatty acyl-CoA reductase CG5065 n=1 Tax=Ptiloglossa arizonensis TaxID=3350558 RepID=UPI003FA03035
MNVDKKRLHARSIEEFFAGTEILITGASGFVGKGLVLKLLHNCPRINTIFILLRSKRRETYEERYKKFIANPIFDKFRTEAPHMLKKIYPVKGDISLPEVGLSPEDKNMLIEKVNIVFHAAATVKFNEPLKVAVDLNLKAIDFVIKLCKDMKNLISYIHVSTAYSNSNRSEVDELIYNTKLKPSTVIEMCNDLDDETLARLQPLILNGHPNTYTFTKNLAEQLISTEGKDLPVTIVRPSIIGAAMKDPYPGWVDNVSGATGSILLIGVKGFIRCIRADNNKRINLVPIDYVVDTLICASWHSTMKQDNSIKVYNCTSNQGGVRLSEFVNFFHKDCVKSASPHLMWYPRLINISNKFVFALCTLILNYFPAFMMDIYLILTRRKAIALKTVIYADSLVNSLHFFRLQEWNFHRQNMEDLTKDLKALTDCNDYITHTNDLEFNNYMYNYLIGIRKYIFKENFDPKNPNTNRLLLLYCIHRFVQISFIILFSALIIKYINF